MMATAQAATASMVDPSEPDVIVATRSGDRNTFFPAMTRLADGEIFVVYYDSESHSQPNGRITGVRSSDGGHTWSTPRVVMDTPMDDRDPSLLQLRDGTTLLTFFARDWASGAVWSYVSRSTDGARTWTNPVRVGTKLDWAATQAPPVELANGDLLIPLYGASESDSVQRATVVRSTDGGRTWSADTEASLGHSAPPNENVNLQEPAIADLGNGRLLALMRSTLPRPGQFAFASWSYDNGRTWTQPEVTDMAAHCPDLLRLTTGHGEMALATWGDVGRQYGPPRPVVGRLVLPNQPIDKLAPQLMYGGVHGADSSCPSSIELGPSRFFTVYYNANLGYIGGTFSNLCSFMPSDETYGSAPPPDAEVLDLTTMAESGDLSVDTDMTWTASSRPGVGPLGAVDGSNDYWHSAVADHAAPPATRYNIGFPTAQHVAAVGLTLKPGYHETAKVFLSDDGVHLDCPVASLTDVDSETPVWVDLNDAPPARHVVVVVTKSEGWAQLTELQVAVPTAP